MSPAARASGARRPPGIARDVRSHAALRRRPLLVRAWALVRSLRALVGAGARRRLSALAVSAAPLATAAAGAALVALRAYARTAPSALDLVALAAVGVALAAVCLRRVRRAAAGVPTGALEQLEIGALLVVPALAAAQLAEGALAPAAGPLAPLVYLVLAFLGASSRRAVAAALAVLAIGVEAAAWRLRGGAPAGLPALAAHAAFALAFAALGRSVLGARLAAAARAERAAVARRLRAIDERARAFRVLGPGAEDGAEERRARAAEAAVVEVDAAVRGALEVVEVALRTHTAALYVATDDGKELRLHECRSGSDRVARALPADEGLPGAAFRGGRAARLQGAVATTWYDDATLPAEALAVPLVDPAGRARGVLLADRLEADPFAARDERLLATLAAEILRAVESERLLADVRRARDESERFYQAIERLNRTAKASEAHDALLDVAAGIVPMELGAVTIVEDLPGGGVRHRVACVRSAAEGRAGLEGLVFEDGPGLVASAVRLGASLPARELDVARAVVFDERTRLRGLGALKVLPLRTADRVLGTLVLGASRRGAYGGDAVRQLEVVAMQAADAILRARLFDETERLATTDGLTGLLNHRAFQARLDEQLAQALRYGRPLALVLADVDHFKRVNDTHGHPVGDEVLRGIARAFGKEARATDVAARYGGEEFALLLPETDVPGALAVAERVRARIASAPFPSSRGPLQVTLSLGVAAVPVHGRAKAPLVQAADEALYASKHAGRDRATAAPAR